MAGGGGIQSLERAAALLDGVAASGGRGISLGELSERTGLHSSTAFHLVRTLESLGLLARAEGSKRYRIGSRLFQLAAGALDESTLLLLGTPVLERLSQTTGDAAHLAVRSNTEIVLIARTAATGMLQMSDRAGVVRPAHATAIGKLLLAACADRDLAGLLERLDLRSFTDRTVTDAVKLRAELAEVRRTGLAHDRAEFDPEVRCVAAAVTDFAGRCAAAIGISGPIWRMDEATVAEKSKTLLAAAGELSALLGADVARAVG